ncbi:metallophosphatase family protein [Alphaproteobacteria bacterium]|nr:metallophosphatase family protein [Alphaproteobacteria bacterium]
MDATERVEGVRGTQIIGILSDAHGNIEAFQAAISHLRGLGVKSFYFLGDAVGYIPSPEVIRVLYSMGEEVKCVFGNHEQLMLQGGTTPGRELIYQHKLVLGALSISEIDFIRSWPSHRREIVSGVSVLFVHGSPSDHTNGYVYPDTDLSQFSHADSFVFMGHSHYAFVRNSNGTTFVNVGSCGLPRDDGRYGSFATFKPERKTVEVYRFAIDGFVSDLGEHSINAIHPSVLRVFQRRKDNVYATSFN